jgi:alpha-methylacyl-CoA racemase
MAGENITPKKRLGGPLTGIRVVEFAGIGPVPFAGMLLSDLGAEVVRIDRVGAKNDLREAVNRGRSFVQADLKDTKSIDQILQLCESADAIMEGFRPGVMERLGLGPDTVLARNPRLVYGRMTGWGQDGPLANSAGHDINYIAISGALAAIGTREAPVPPLNLVGDYGGGSLYFVMALLAGIIEARSSSQGQVVDVAMCDGAASLLSMFSSLSAIGLWREERSSNVIDGGSHFYNVYECADGKFISVGAIEPAFYALLKKLLGLNESEIDDQNNSSTWPAQKDRFKEIFRTRSQAEWCALLEGTDACFAPVLTMSDAPKHRQYQARESFIEHNGITQPAPVPRYSRTVCRIQDPKAPNLSLADVAARWKSRTSQPSGSRS